MSFAKIRAYLGGPFGRRLVLVLALGVVMACGVRALFKPMDGDFKLHWEFASRFVAGENLYAGGLHTPYPPFWAMAHAPVSFLPLPVAKAVLFPLGVAAVAGLVWVMASLARRALGAAGWQEEFWIAALALLLASRYFLRDFAELGVNTQLVLLTWGAIWLWTRGQDALGGIVLGLAAALKCTPALFIAYFLWKREWRLGGVALVAAGVFTLAPGLWMGPGQFGLHMEQWTGAVLRGTGSKDPSVGVLGPEQFQNMALRPSLARYLMRLEIEHPGRTDHPWYFDGLSLPAEAADWVTKAGAACVVGAVLWLGRRRVVSRNDGALLWEFAALGVAMLLLSPITWGQHAVAVFPACYLLAWAMITHRPATLRPWMWGVVAFYCVFVLLLSRDLVGRPLSYVLDSYHVQTIALVGLFCVALGMLKSREI